MAVTRSVFQWQCRDRQLELGRTTRIMGVLNLTPDSFSDGGSYPSTSQAVDRALLMVEEGADIIDIGGESTRPGASAVTEQEEIARVLPVIEALTQHPELLLSIDTSKTAVARAALAKGAHIINDVTAFNDFEGMVGAAKDFNAGIVLMHMQGRPDNMQDQPRYDNVLSEVTGFLSDRCTAVISSGIRKEQIVVDPGIGFGKRLEDNLTLLRGIPQMVEALGPVLIGLSRKQMLGTLTGRDVGDRLAASLAGLSWSVSQGAHIIRVHDVKESCDSVKVLDILCKDNGHG